MLSRLPLPVLLLVLSLLPALLRASAPAREIHPLDTSNLKLETPISPQRTPLAYAPAPVDNPLKGLVPYQADVRSRFPHSLEFNYLPYSALVKGYEDFDWTPLEKLLNDIASRGHQAVFRVFLEYPNRKEVIPTFLLRDGLKVHTYTNSNTQPFPPSLVETPDYADPNLRRSLRSFITALGRKYDGDPRIGFITAGLLGTWGEWHTHPRNDLFASREVQREVMDAYESAFRTTPVLLRYPAGDNDPRKQSNADRPFGYHDDSFAWATLDTGRKADSWFYLTVLQAAGPGALAKWKTQPIGGEIRPEAWGRVFDPNPGDARIQDFQACVEATHASWLMDSGMFRTQQPEDRLARATNAVRRMGYEFHAPAVTIGPVANHQVEVRLEVANRGVAPFYYEWKPEYALLDGTRLLRTFTGSGKLRGILPGENPTVWTDRLNLQGLPSGKRRLAVRIRNPLPNGKPLRFANATQDPTQDWLWLGEVIVP